jgi:SsrA-binding protein
VRRPTQDPVVARNKRARHDYHLEGSWEAGIVLQGTEVRSLREGRASLVDGFVDVEHGEVWMHGVHIPASSHDRAPDRTRGSGPDRGSRRKRKLLLHRSEIDRIERRLAEKGVTVVPLRLYFKDGRAKVELALGRGKREWDKRQALAERQAARETEQAVARRAKGRPG